jgi:adenosylhomocysteinase
MLADGNAVNFLHGASVGAFIFLVQAEILAALGSLASACHKPGLHPEFRSSWACEVRL